MLLVFSVLAAVAVLVALLKLGRTITATSVALALILGGALGNAYDRLRFGSVIDFLEVHIVHYHWPDFNVADSAIVIGGILLLLDALFSSKEEAEFVTISVISSCNRFTRLNGLTRASRMTDVFKGVAGSLSCELARS